MVAMIILWRLKMFVYLHDIDCEEGHPTEVPMNKYSISNKFEIWKQIKCILWGVRVLLANFALFPATSETLSYQQIFYFKPWESPGGSRNTQLGLFRNWLFCSFKVKYSSKAVIEYAISYQYHMVFLIW